MKLMPDATLGTSPQIIPPRVPLLDPRTGLIAREWYRFFLSLYSAANASTIDVDALLIGPSAENSPVYAELLNIYGQIQNVDQASSSLAVLESQIQALAVAPTMPEVQALAFGSFTRSAAATATAINTPQTVSFEAQELSQGIEWTASNPTRIYVYTPGAYNFQFSAQMTKTSASLGYAWIWPAINGVDVANSASRVSFQGSNSDLVAAWNWFLTMKSGDYFELKWTIDNLNITLVQDSAPSFGPNIPAVILTANRVSL